MKEHLKLIYIIIIYMIFSVINLLDNTYLSKQILWYLIGFIIIIIINIIGYKKVFKYSYIIYFTLNILLLYLLLFGESINGSRAWINIFGISLQPSEFMKINLICLLCNINKNIKHYNLLITLIVLIPSILTFLEPDTGNVIFFIIILLIFIKYSLKPLLITSSLLLVLGFTFYIILLTNKNLLIDIFGSSNIYRINRLLTFKNNNSYQLSNALIGIGSHKLIYIPESTTDFAFSLLIIKNGLIGTVIYLLSNIIFNITLINLYIKTKLQNIKKYILAFQIIILIQETIHMYMNVGLFPITGITLPYISLGGSSLLSLFIGISLIISYSKDNNYYKDN